MCLRPRRVTCSENFENETLGPLRSGVLTPSPLQELYKRFKAPPEAVVLLLAPGRMPWGVCILPVTKVAIRDQVSGATLDDWNNVHFSLGGNDTYRALVYSFNGVLLLEHVRQAVKDLVRGIRV